MADTPLEVKPDKGTTVDAVCDLIKGATLLKAGRSGRPHFRQFRLSSDLTKLMWESAKKTDAAVLISQISEMKLGQTTPNFKRNPLPQCEALSFSLLYSDRSLDIICKDKREFEIWTSGIKALMENCVDKQLVEDRLKQAGQNTSEDKLTVQMGSTLKRFGATVIVKEDACDLYLWGGGSRGKLGHKEDEKEMWPRVVEALLGKNITMVACGMAHTMALSSKGMVFTWGAGANGQLGHGNLRDRYSPLMVDKPLRGLEIVHISCYEYHSAVLSAEGKVFTWGKAGPYLGYSLEGGSTKQLVPRQVEFLAGEKIIHLACGRLHTLACADSGQVFSFGVNKFGELGLGHEKETTKPVLIPELQSAYRVACGRHHSAAIDEDGVLWMWGWGGRGQLGNSTMKSQFQPVTPEGFNEQTVEDVSCGYGHTGTITANGIAFCWGDNSAGQVGVPTTAYNEIAQPRPLVTPTGTRPKQITCGANYTAIITNGGQMFTWGCGTAGQLGHGNLHKSVCQLMEVDALVGKKVVAASSGEEHMGCLVVHGWVPDDEARSCMACQKPFTAVRRRHHCRNCGGIFCSSCSAKKYPLLEKGHSDPVRVCDRCFVSLSAD